MASPSDRPAPRFGPRVRTYEQEITAEFEQEIAELNLKLCERDMEIERLRADLDGIRDQCRVIWWSRSNILDYPIEHNMSARVDMFDVILSYVRAARAASRDGERDHG